MNKLEFLRDYFTKEEYFVINQKYPKVNGKQRFHQTMLNINDDSVVDQLKKLDRKSTRLNSSH